eukprot:GDKH01000016.1.p1 GENE.GDKH01000016.1~~GDKH01000016.1.p1  ORF type:complete len:98 (+),score=6.41 GDKH01000016.1:1-294(+)
MGGAGRRVPPRGRCCVLCGPRLDPGMHGGYAEKYPTAGRGETAIESCGKRKGQGSRAVRRVPLAWRSIFRWRWQLRPVWPVQLPCVHLAIYWLIVNH